MAHIDKRSTNKGEVRYDVRYRALDGAERSKTFRTKKEAERFAASATVAVANQTWIDPRSGKLKFETYANEWLKHRPGLKPLTRQTYGDQLRLHIMPTLGNAELDQLNPRDVRLWHSHLSASSLSPNTVAKCYRLLRTILTTAVEDEIIVRNPCQIRNAGVERVLERPTITAQEVWVVADRIGTRYRCAVLLGGFMGLRVGEILGLERRHIDLDEALLIVDQQEQELRDGELIVTSPKSMAGRRTLSLPDFLVSELAAHLKSFVEPALTARVFVGEKGGGLRRHVLHKQWDATRMALGLPDGFRFHDLRHTANTLMATTGASTRELMHRMGHASPEAALRYQHATKQRDVALAAAFDALVAGDRIVPGDGSENSE